MKLFYKPLACSMAVHIALRELELPFELIRVENVEGKLQAARRDYLDIFPLGAVPALELEDGDIMAEGAVILEYLAAQAETPSLAPKSGDSDYWTFRQIMNFIATDIHKNYGPIFHPSVSPEMKQVWLGRLDKRLTYLASILEKQPYLLARGYTIADIYMFVMLLWCSYAGVDVNKWPSLAQYFKILSERPAIQQVVAIEKG